MEREEEGVIVQQMARLGVALEAPGDQPLSICHPMLLVKLGWPV